MHKEDFSVEVCFFPHLILRVLIPSKYLETFIAIMRLPFFL